MYGYSTVAGTITIETDYDVSMEQLRDLVEQVDPAELYDDNVEALLETVASYVQNDGDVSSFMETIMETYAYKLAVSNNVKQAAFVLADSFASAHNPANEYGQEIAGTMGQMQPEEIEQFVFGFFSGCPAAVKYAHSAFGIVDHSEDMQRMGGILRTVADTLDLYATENK